MWGGCKCAGFLCVWVLLETEVAYEESFCVEIQNNVFFQWVLKIYTLSSVTIFEIPKQYCIEEIKTNSYEAY